MLDNIKSPIIKKKLFILLDEVKILKLLQHNKKLQQFMNITLMNYQLFSGNYILYEENGNRKEYNLNGSLIFDGEYLNGKRNGKGKEYNEGGRLIFEGKYYNGLKWIGEGKEYYNNGILRFEGEYLHGKRNGKGKE